MSGASLMFAGLPSDTSRESGGLAMSMQFLYNDDRDAFLEWHTGILVTTTRTARIPSELRPQAVWMLGVPLFLIECQPSDDPWQE